MSMQWSPMSAMKSELENGGAVVKTEVKSETVEHIESNTMSTWVC